MITAEDHRAADELLRNAKTIAVVGLDDRTERTAYHVADYLRRQGIRIIPVPKQKWADEVFGEKAYKRVQDIPDKIDFVDVFVRSEHTGDVIDEAIEAGVPGIWLQQGITNDEGLERARAAGLVVTQDRCTLVEHQRMTRSQ
jgi:predicted CoA-binding protein